MATFGHIAAGVALARAGGAGRDWLVIGTLAIAAVAPDVDLIVGSNHRGPTHSVGFAVVTAGACAAMFSAIRHPRAMVIGGLAGAAVLTHIALDLLAAQSPVAALWPLSTREFTLPFLVLPAAPTDEALFTTRGVLLVGAELAWSIALVVGAGWRRDRTVRGSDASPQEVTQSLDEP